MASTFLNLLDPYLPSSLLGPVHQVINSLSSLSSSPAQLLPLLISLLTLYAALSSLYHTTRVALRLAWFVAKWGAIAAALGGTLSSWSNWGKPVEQQGTSLGMAGRTAWSLGKRGVEWWGDKPASRRGRSAAKSASGRRRTWAKANDDGEWDDPEEGNEAMDFVKDTVLTFLGGGGSDKPAGTKKAPGARGKGKTLKKGKKVDKENKGVDLGSLAMNFALGRARKVWDELAEGLGGTVDEARRR